MIKITKDGCVEFSFTLYRKKKRLFWLHYQNTKMQKKIWGDCGKYHFTLIIGKWLDISTAFVGKKLFGRINLLQLFKKDFRSYSCGDDVQSGC